MSTNNFQNTFLAWLSSKICKLALIRITNLKNYKINAKLQLASGNVNEILKLSNI